MEIFNCLNTQECHFSHNRVEIVKFVIIVIKMCCSKFGFIKWYESKDNLTIHQNFYENRSNKLNDSWKLKKYIFIRFQFEYIKWNTEATIILYNNSEKVDTRGVPEALLDLSVARRLLASNWREKLNFIRIVLKVWNGIGNVFDLEFFKSFALKYYFSRNVFLQL